jgi:hypothetical protein
MVFVAHCCFHSISTALLGEYLFTDHAAPAVVLYNAVVAVQAIGWILVSGRTEKSIDQE